MTIWLLLFDIIFEKLVLVVQRYEIIDLFRLVVASVPKLDSTNIFLQLAFDQNKEVDFLQILSPLFELAVVLFPFLFRNGAQILN